MSNRSTCPSHRRPYEIQIFHAKARQGPSFRYVATRALVLPPFQRQDIRTEQSRTAGIETKELGHVEPMIIGGAGIATRKTQSLAATNQDLNAYRVFFALGPLFVAIED